jgi:hypothetical protein
LTSITPPSGAAIGAMPSLAEAEAVMANEASSAAAIRTKRLIWFSPSHYRDLTQVPDERICSVVSKLNHLRIFQYGNCREKLARQALMICRESWMNSPDIAEAAFARAWSVYRLIHSGIDENDARRASLQRFIQQRCEAGETDTELLAVEGLKYLKSLEGIPEE